MGLSTMLISSDPFRDRGGLFVPPGRKHRRNMSVSQGGERRNLCPIFPEGGDPAAISMIGFCVRLLPARRTAYPMADASGILAGSDTGFTTGAMQKGKRQGPARRRKSRRWAIV
jgi:hypothetical protein